ncbi:MAG: class I SAM-dependent methyltransferase [Solirubrobacterales bacterium]
MNTGPREWDADTYDAIADPQFEWGVEVLERLELAGDETVLDAGAGSGRVTERLLERLPQGRVIVLDGSEDMIAKARERLGDRVDYLVMDLAELESPEPVDLVFSTATFHWVLDHDNLFRRIHGVLRPGGRLVAQCGGAGNVARLAEAIAKAAADPEIAPHFEGMSAMWNFASPEETKARLEEAGFDEIRCELDPKPVRPDRPREYVSTSGLGPHLSHLPDDLRDRFIDSVMSQLDEPVTLDYVRLNIHARRREGAPSEARSNP